MYRKLIHTVPTVSYKGNAYVLGSSVTYTTYPRGNKNNGGLNLNSYALHQTIIRR